MVYGEHCIKCRCVQLVTNCSSISVIEVEFHLFTRSVRKETELFFICSFTYNLIKLFTFKVLPSTLTTPPPTFFQFQECVLEHVLLDGTKVLYQIFFYLLYCLKSATFSEDFHFGNKKKSAGATWRVGWLGDKRRLMLCQKFMDKEWHVTDAAQILRQHDASSIFWSKSGGTNFYSFLLLWQLHAQLGDNFDESQQALSKRDHRPLTWKAVQIWGCLRWMFCPIWNTGTTRDIAYGSNSPLHKPVVTSEKSL